MQNNIAIIPSMRFILGIHNLNLVCRFHIRFSDKKQEYSLELYYRVSGFHSLAVQLFNAYECNMITSDSE